MDRRDFIKVSGAAEAGMALVGCRPKGTGTPASAGQPTLDFIAWLKEQPLLKGILCGHMHRFFEERFSETAVQYCVGATYKGDAQVVHFK